MSIASEITRLQLAKADIKTAIENKGVTVADDAKLDSYAGLVDNIKLGGGDIVTSNFIPLNENAINHTLGESLLSLLSENTVTIDSKRYYILKEPYNKIAVDYYLAVNVKWCYDLSNRIRSGWENTSSSYKTYVILDCKAGDLIKCGDGSNLQTAPDVNLEWAFENRFDVVKVINNGPAILTIAGAGAGDGSYLSNILIIH